MAQHEKQAHGPEQKFVTDLPRNLTWRRNRLASPPASQPSVEVLAQRMRRFELFAHLPEALLLTLAASSAIRTFTAGEYLWHQDEPNRRVLFIERGMARTARTIRAGVTRTYGLYGPGDSMGIYAIWSGMKYPTDAMALSDGMTAIVLDSAALLKCAKKQAVLAAPLLVEVGRFTEAFIRKIEIVSAGSVPQRLAALMVMLVDRYGVEAPGGGTRVPIYLTLAHMGEIVDARLETVARVLGRWKRQGWLHVSDEGFSFTSTDNLRELLSALPDD